MTAWPLRRQLAWSASVMLVVITGWRIVVHAQDEAAAAAARATDDTGRYGVNRYSPFRQLIDANHGIVGFVGEPASGTEGEMIGKYQLACYVMAPLVVARTTGVGVIIADFPDEYALQDFLHREDLIILAPIGPGLALVGNPREGGR